MKKTVHVNAILNMLRQLLAILFPMVTVYYATRVLGQHNFGDVNYIKSIISYFSLFAGLGISNYAIREGAYIRDDSESYNKFANEVFTINVISTCITYFALFFLCFVWIRQGLSSNAYLALILSISIILTTLGADWINTTFEDFLYITVRYILFYLIAIGLLFLLVKSTDDSYWYAGVTVVASTGGNLLNILYIRKYAKLRLARLHKLKRHLKPILILFGSSIASVIYISADTTMIGIMVSREAVAVYVVASNIYIAIKHVANAAITVTMPRLSNYIGSGLKDKYNDLFEMISSYVIVILLPLVVGTFELSDSLMIIMGGSEYLVGSQTLQVLSFALLFAVINYVLSRCITLPYKEDTVFTVSTAISALVNILLNIILIPNLSFLGAAITTLISEIIVFSILYINSKKHIHINFNLKTLSSSFIGCVGIVFICEVVKKILSVSPLAIIFTSFIVSVVVYLVILYSMKNHVVLNIINSIKLKKHSPM